jgi:hypothetical protein
MKRNRPDLGTFTSGNVYRHSATGELIEFVGIAFAARAGDEDIAVFRPVTRLGAPVTADRAGYEQGERFEPVLTVDWSALEVRDPAVAVNDVNQVDRDDIFGVRHALEALPDNRRDGFLQRWAQIGDGCEYDLHLVRNAAVREVRDNRSHDPALADAWTTVSSAMATYLAWRARRRGRGAH